MIKHNLIAAAICTAIFIGCFFFGEGGRFLYFNLASFLVVSSGTIGAAFLSFPYDRLKNAYRVALNSYKKDAVNSPDEIVNILLDISVRSRYDGILCGSRNLFNDFFFQVTETGFAPLGKNSGDGHAGAFLNEPVGFNEVSVQTPGQPLAGGGLA